jgi:hypothetical protein
MFDSKASLSAFWREGLCLASSLVSSFAAKALILNGFNLRTASYGAVAKSEGFTT